MGLPLFDYGWKIIDFTHGKEKERRGKKARKVDFLIANEIPHPGSLEK